MCVGGWVRVVCFLHIKVVEEKWMFTLPYTSNKKGEKKIPDAYVAEFL